MRTDDPNLQDNPLVEMGYEPKDLASKSIRRFAVAFFAFAIVSFAAVFAFFKIAKLDLAAADRARAEALPFQNRIPEAPNPLLQSNVTAKKDIADMRKEESDVLSQYAWIDRDKGIVRLPIERAIALAAQRGLPTTGRSVEAESRGTDAPEVLRAREAAGGP